MGRQARALSGTSRSYSAFDWVEGHLSAPCPTPGDVLQGRKICGALKINPVSSVFFQTLLIAAIVLRKNSEALPSVGSKLLYQL